MIRLNFTCELLADVVLSATPATQGFHPSLDYLPGAKFLGMVAAHHYDTKRPEATLDLFHNGCVRYGDATPLLGDEAALPVPHGWFFAKGAGLVDSQLYAYHRLGADDFAELTGQGIQLKQARRGYFAPKNLTYTTVPQTFNLRSAYDREQRRAKDSQMFGYYALPAGSRWAFGVEDDTGRYADQITEALVGRHRIGRSRSAEYGLVEIEAAEPTEVDTLTPTTAGDGLTVLYAQSNLCFTDAAGRTTLRPTAAQLGADGGEIVWERSQVRTRPYRTWNQKRNNLDADRVVIERGAVLVLRGARALRVADGVGSYRAEGFGRVLVNPDFLHADGPELPFRLTSRKPSEPTASTQPDPTTEADQRLLSLLARRATARTHDLDVDGRVNAFVHKHGSLFSGVSASQWGLVRRMAQRAPDYDGLRILLFEEQMGALHHGQSEAVWRKKDRRGKLEKDIADAGEAWRAFTIKLAAEMAKNKQPHGYNA